MTSRSQAFLAAIGSADSWGEIHAAWASKTEKEKGDRFEDLTKAYLQLAPEYASKLKNVWRLDEVPAVTRKKLNLPATDKGIDLIAETHEGEFWAVQCKYRQNTDQQLTHTDISTFTSLTFQACKGISYALVCSTTERVTQLYRGEERIGFCALDTWQELDRDFFDRLRASLASKPVKLEPRKPRPHQQNAVRDGLEHFAKSKEARGKLIMPCGTGKSLTAWFLAQALGSKRIVIAVPSLSLVKQTLKVWLRESVANDIDVEWICVCSDETAGKADQDDVVVQRQDIAVPCYTSTDKIADWLRTKHKGLTVVFTTYQSGDVLATAARKAKFSFDLGIMDEAHKTVGDGDKQFSILLHDHNIEIGQRVFMTATERRYKGSSDKVLSMDDAEVYGDTFHQLSFKQAMECQPPILCDYNVITIGVSRQEIKDLIKQNVFVRPTGGKWDEEMEADMLAAMVALRKAMKEHPIKHAVSFHGSIQRAELFKAHNDTFTQEFPEFGNLETFHVSGQTPTGTRSNIIKAFAQSERSLVTNARCLTEGVDVPGIDCVLFADPRKSTVDIVQAVGRALRPSEGKKLGYVILPVLHETDATSEQVIDSGAFKEILTTISALASNDDRIIEYFRGISQGRNPSGSARVSFEWDERLAQNIDVAKLVHELEIKCWGRLAKLSWRPFAEARAFVHKLGLRNNTEWRKYCKNQAVGISKPRDIPQAPDKSYSKAEWINWGDWLGTGNLYKREYMQFEKARDFVSKLGLKSSSEWKKYIAGEMAGKTPFPNDIPYNPAQIYRDKGWVSMGDWLGTGRVASQYIAYRDFESARNFARSLNLKSGKDWLAFCRGELKEKGILPHDIPFNPAGTYYGKGWSGIGDWLGTGNIAYYLRQYRNFEDARHFARSLKLSKGEDWLKFTKGGFPGLGLLPKDIPAAPQMHYADKGWQGMSDWLGTDKVNPKVEEYLPYELARDFVVKLKLESSAKWHIYCKDALQHLPKLPRNIPKNPARVYKLTGWTSYGNWLGTGMVATYKRDYWDFERARDFAQSLNLLNITQWRDYCKAKASHLPVKPEGVPANPNQVYAEQWKGYGDWLGTGNVAKFLMEFWPFDEARNYVRSLNLKSATEWSLYCKGKLSTHAARPTYIPTAPMEVYKNDGWNGMGDWLGTNRVADQKKTYLSFTEARAYARSLKIGSALKWHDFCQGKLPLMPPKRSDVPANPKQTYANKGWNGYSDWLGTMRVAYRDRTCRNFTEARSFSRSLGLKSSEEWRLFCAGKLPRLGKLPVDIPSNVRSYYKDKGWISWDDWLARAPA